MPRERRLTFAAGYQRGRGLWGEHETPERQKLWVRFPIDVQKRWLSHLVARTRAMREHPSSNAIRDRLKTIRAVYPEWAREYVPGHINGLQLKHLPPKPSHLKLQPVGDRGRSKEGSSSEVAGYF